MISYSPFYATLERKKMTTYKLIKNHKISTSLLDRLRHNKPVSTTTINDLCRILNCRVEDVLEYIPSEEDQIL